MKRLKQIINWIRDSKGVATSLIEATATVAVGAVLAGVAVGGAIDAINDSKIQAAIGDVSAIGTGVITFYKDNAFFPLFTDGNKTGPADDFYGFLVSENGTYPTDSTVSLGGTSWDIPATADTTAWTGNGNFGHMPDYQIGANGHSTIEGHLIRNFALNLTGADPTARTYPLRGSYTGDPSRGWAGPYVSSLPKTDPWGDKYLINVRNLHTGYLTTVSTDATNLAKLGVIVISAGPNRNIETRVDQKYDAFAAAGDDIVFRIK